MTKILKTGKYLTISGEIYNVLKDTKPLCENNGDTFYKMLDIDGKTAIIPLSRIVEEPTDGIKYSTSHTTAAGKNNEGTDSTGGRAKSVKRKKKKKPNMVTRNNDGAKKYGK